MTSRSTPTLNVVD